MVTLVLVLTIAGYVMTAGGVLLFLFTTPRAIASIGKRADEIETSVNRMYAERLARLPEDASPGDLDREMIAERVRLYGEADIPYTAGLSFGGPDHETVMAALRHVWRANRGNTFVAVVGGAVSTTASALSLFL